LSLPRGIQIGSRGPKSRISRRAGITNFRSHDCRHAWATWHCAANRDLAALIKLAGWKSERMVLSLTLLVRRGAAVRMHAGHARSAHRAETAHLGMGAHTGSRWPCTSSITRRQRCRRRVDSSMSTKTNGSRRRSRVLRVSLIEATPSRVTSLSSERLRYSAVRRAEQ
jgi:hypothetical protein